MELPGQELLEFLLEAVDHATSRVVPRGGPLVPFAIVDGAGGSTFHQVVEQDLVLAQEQVRFVVQQETGVRMACVAWDGYVTVDGVRTDAVFVDGCDDSGEPGYVFVQRYGRAGRFRRSMIVLGNTAVSSRSERLFD